MSEFVFRTPADAIAHGIGMVQQHFSLVSAFTATENFALGGHGKLGMAEERRRLERFARDLGLSVASDARPSELSPAEQQQLEIAKALGKECRILILDEPGAVLLPSKAAGLHQWIRSFADAGGSVVLVTHKMREARAIADDVTVLRHGQTVLSTAAASVDEEPLLTAMLGEDRSATPDLASGEMPTVANARVAALESVSVQDTARRERLHDVSLAVSSGEIIGVAGVERSGYRLLLRILSGRLAPERGKARIAAAVGFIAEDRHREAIALDLDVRENIALKGARSRRGWISWHEWGAYASQLMRDFGFYAPSDKVAMRTLSGGNQQKVVLAREMAGRPDLIVAENPTRGLDVRAAKEIRQRLRAAAEAGAAVVWYSSDLDELATETQRVLALYEGHVRQCAPSRDAIGRAMLGTL